MDRYYLSSAVYQGALGLDPAEILELHASFAPEPDLTIVLDVDPGTARERIHAARGSADSFEGHEYLSAVRELYLGMIDGETVVRVDARPDADAVHEALLAVVLPRLAVAS